MNILAIGAHGDDLEEFCGGTLALFSRKGHHVVMCVVTDGRGRPQGDPEQIVAIRKQEAHSAADVIGAELVWLAVPDGEVHADEATRRQVVQTIRASAPDLIITHSLDDYHPDHNATSRLTMDAAQLARTTNYHSDLPPIRKPVPVAFMDTELGIDFQPEDYVDISSVWEVKQQMLLQHRSQHMPGPKYDPNFVLPPPEQNAIIRTARIMSEFRGLACDASYAEGFRWWRAANRIIAKRLLP
ncbi:MAG TPA: PIG-L family deacetylase [Aggregatilineales bacterium]|nr:PIG-L family deacetylase [Aggregatilineales bacterium]